MSFELLEQLWSPKGNTNYSLQKQDVSFYFVERFYSRALAECQLYLFSACFLQEMSPFSCSQLRDMDIHRG